MHTRGLALGLIFLVAPGCKQDTAPGQDSPGAGAPSALVDAVGIDIGDGPHKGLVQEVKGTQVEIVPTPQGEIRAYVSDENGAPVAAKGQITAEISAPQFSPAEVELDASPDGAFFVGRLPGPPPKVPAQVEITFPDQGVTIVYPQVALIPDAVAEVQVDAEPPRFDDKGQFLPPHRGTVQNVGDKHVEVVVAPSGEVQVYAYEKDGNDIPCTEIQLKQVNVIIDGRPQVITLAPDPEGIFFVGRVTAVAVTPKVKVEVSFPAPVVIHATPIEVPPLPIVEVHPIVVVYRPHDHGHHYGEYKHGGYAGGVDPGHAYPGGEPDGYRKDPDRDGYRGEPEHGGYTGGAAEKEHDDGYRGEPDGYRKDHDDKEHGEGYRGEPERGGYTGGAAEKEHDDKEHGEGYRGEPERSGYTGGAPSEKEKGGYAGGAPSEKEHGGYTGGAAEKEKGGYTGGAPSEKEKGGYTGGTASEKEHGGYTGGAPSEKEHGGYAGGTAKGGHDDDYKAAPGKEEHGGYGAAKGDDKGGEKTAGYGAAKGGETKGEPRVAPKAERSEPKAAPKAERVETKAAPAPKAERSEPKAAPRAEKAEPKAAPKAEKAEPKAAPKAEKVKGKK